MYRLRVLVAFLSAIVLVFAAAGCGGNSGDDGDSASRTTPDLERCRICNSPVKVAAPVTPLKCPVPPVNVTVPETVKSVGEPVAASLPV